MDKLKKLENIKLMKEFDFIESEFNLKNEIIVDADSNFLKTVNDYLNDRPELKKIFNDKVDKKMEEMLEKKKKEDNDDGDQIENEGSSEDLDSEGNKINEDDGDKINEDEENKIIFRNDKIKKLYREIAKVTHPDKI